MNRKTISIWKNPGTSNITFSNGNVYFFWPYHGVTAPQGLLHTPTTASPNNGFSNSDFSIQPNYWFEIPTAGYDHLIIQYQSKLEAVGTITNVASNSLAFALQGRYWTPDTPAIASTLRKPQALLATIPADGRTGTPELAAWELKVQRISTGRSWDDANRFANVTAAGGTEHHQGAIFILGNCGDTNSGAPAGTPATAANRTPLTTDYPGWCVFIHQRTANVPIGGALGNYYPYPSLAGIERVWFAASFFADWAGAGPMRINGEMTAILLQSTDRGL